MAISKKLISDFAKLTKPEIKDEGTEVNGTFKVIGGVEYVQIDGSDILTPVSTAVEAVEDERVVVLIKDHAATVTKNITSPAARNKSVESLKDEVDEFGNTIHQMDNSIIQQGNSITQMDNTINQHSTTINQHDTLINQQGDTIISLDNTIVQQGNTISSMNNTIVQQGDNINSMNNTINQQGDHITSMNNIVNQQGNRIDQQGNTISQQGNQISQQNNIIEEQGNRITSIDNQMEVIDNTVTLHDSNIIILNSGFKIVDGVLTGLSQVIVDRLETNHLNTGYAKIDFANINTAAIEKLFSDSGIIRDLVMEEGHVTGELVGVTIKGDVIEGNTIIADKLVIKGEDGVYYKLNMDAETVESEQTNENSLDGNIITTQSITASKVVVSDLVAFGATIAGFIIDEEAIYSEGKDSINSEGQGIYMDKEGQFYLGDIDNHIRYYKDENDKYVLDINADNIYIGSEDINANFKNAVSDLTEKLAELGMSYEEFTLSFRERNGNNLIRNSAMKNGREYWFKEPYWLYDEQHFPPENPETGRYWYVTEDYDIYIRGVMYKWDGNEWVETDKQRYEFNETFIEGFNPEENEETRRTTISGSIINVTSGNYGEKTHVFGMVEEIPLERSQKSLALSLKLKQEINAGNIYIGYGFTPDRLGTQPNIKNEIHTIKEGWIQITPDDCVELTDIEKIIEVPSSNDILKGVYGEEPDHGIWITDNQVYMKDENVEGENDEGIDPQNEQEWTRVTDEIIEDQDGYIWTWRSFYNRYYKTEFTRETFDAKYCSIFIAHYPGFNITTGTELPEVGFKDQYFGITDSEEPFGNFVFRAKYENNMFQEWVNTGFPTIGLEMIDLPVPTFPNNKAVPISGSFYFADLKLAYGDVFSLWTGHKDEIYGQNFKFDGTGLFIYSGQNKMYINEDTIMATYNEEVIFQITEELTKLKYLVATRAKIAGLQFREQTINGRKGTIIF